MDIAPSDQQLVHPLLIEDSDATLAKLDLDTRVLTLVLIAEGDLVLKIVGVRHTAHNGLVTGRDRMGPAAPAKGKRLVKTERSLPTSCGSNLRS